MDWQSGCRVGGHNQGGPLKTVEPKFLTWEIMTNNKAGSVAAHAVISAQHGSLSRLVQGQKRHLVPCWHGVLSSLVQGFGFGQPNTRFLKQVSCEICLYGTANSWKEYHSGISVLSNQTPPAGSKGGAGR